MKNKLIIMGAVMGILLSVPLSLFGFQRADTSASIAPAAGAKSALRILYVGNPESERTKDYVSFLGEHFAQVKTGDLASFKPEQTTGSDVVILDYDGRGFGEPRVEIPTDYSRATVTVGVRGGMISSSLKLKTAYAWNCMTDAAHVGSQTHEVFQKPFKVIPQIEEWDTPGNYRSAYVGEGELPDKIKVWRIQNVKEDGQTSNSVATRSWNFDEFPDAEILTPGFNTGKEYGAAGVSRHGNFLQWGFSGAPGEMTEAGKNFFLNCINYIKKFDGKAPVVRTTSASPKSRRFYRMYAPKIDQERYTRYFSEELVEKYKDNPAGLVKHFEDNYEFIYCEGSKFLIDEELKSLGLDSNRKVATLQQLIAMLSDDSQDDTAQQLLDRYTDQSFDTAEEWEKWLDENRNRLFFSDTGGYKFFAVPKGYLDKPSGASKKLDVSVLYVGQTDSERAQSFLSLMSENFAQVETCAQDNFNEEQTANFDVVVLDYARPRRARGERGVAGGQRGARGGQLQLSENYSQPTVVFGAFGTRTCLRWLSPQTSYTWSCLTDAAHVETLNHQVFQKPFKITPPVEVWDTPPNYRNFPSGDGLPDTVKIWRIQNVAEKGKSSRGVVVSPYGIAENPNAEILAPGLSTSKEYGAVGVARYGHYLYWGYSGTPDVMTDAGKKFFVNCLYYMSEAGK